MPQNINEEALNYELVERLVCHIVEAEAREGPGVLLAPADRPAAAQVTPGKLADTQPNSLKGWVVEAGLQRGIHMRNCCCCCCHDSS